MIKNKLKILHVFFLTLICIGIFLRFINLNWGTPYYFHPDERNIIYAVTRIEFPEKLNPEFFAYGALPIYTIYFINVFQNFLQQNTPINVADFSESIIISRLISAILSSLIIFLVFRLLKKRLNYFYAITGSLLTAFNVGLIQYSHFGTFEIWLAFLFLLLFYLIINFLEKPKVYIVLFIGMILGALLSVKVSSVVIAPFIFIIIILKLYRTFKKNFVSKSLLVALIILLSSLCVILITNPYAVLDFNSFKGSMEYESGVALGGIKVFYTGGFENTIPIFYQLLYVYPFLFNPINLISLIVLLPHLLVRVFRKYDYFVLISLLFFAVIFFSQAFFFVKWTRYYIPTLPFLIILLTLSLNEFFRKFKLKNNLKILIPALLIFSSLFYSFSYLKTVLAARDTRILASEFLKENISNDSKIISEVYDLGIVPFNDTFTNITLFDFYSLDDKFVKEVKSEELKELVETSDYFILPSQRVLRNRIINKESFPEGFKFYDNLSNYKLIHETPCDIFCKILYMGNPIYNIEETINVFDRPVVKIYKLNDR